MKVNPFANIGLTPSELSLCTLEQRAILIKLRAEIEGIKKDFANNNSRKPIIYVWVSTEFRAFYKGRYFSGVALQTDTLLKTPYKVVVG